MNTYLLFKSLHLIAVISWMAVFYIFQEFLFTIHKIMKNHWCQKYLKSWKKTFLHYDLAMSLSWIFGLILIHEIGFDQLGKSG